LEIGNFLLKFGWKKPPFQESWTEPCWAIMLHWIFDQKCEVHGDISAFILLLLLWKFCYTGCLKKCPCEAPVDQIQSKTLH
jgi:hypothetical protein